MTTSRIVLLILGPAAATLLIGSVLYLTGVLTFTQHTIGESIHAFEISTTVEEDTAGICGDTYGTIPCSEGWRTGVGNFMRFTTDSQAEYWHYAIGGDSLRNGNVVVDMNGLDLSLNDRQLAVQMLYPGRDW